MAVLFLGVSRRFAGAPAGGSGTVNQWTYTVPAGKRAVLEHLLLQVNNNGNAANTTGCDVISTVNGGAAIEVFRFMSQSGAAQIATKEMRSHIDLSAGDIVTGRTINTGAGAVTMLVNAIIREYQ